MESRISLTQPKRFVLIWPLVGLLNGILMAIDTEMSAAFIANKASTGPHPGSPTDMLGAMTVLVLIIFGAVQMTHGWRKKSAGVQVGITTFFCATALPSLFLRAHFFRPLGTYLFSISGYGSLDFFYSYVFYILLIVLAFAVGVDRHMPDQLKPS